MQSAAPPTPPLTPPATTPATTGGAGPAAPLAEPLTLRVLVYNVEYGGTASTDRVIRQVDADVVGVLESYNRLPRIAARAGYRYYNVGLQLLSKYPILEPSGAQGRYALIEVRPGLVVPFVNAHLDSVRYGPRLLAKGEPARAVLASEREVRLSSMRKLLAPVRPLLAAGQPVLLTGDFNEPSHLDYTAAMVGRRPGVSRVMRWPVSEAVLAAGLRDTFRTAHPDPRAVPGITWGAKPDGSGDRIDFVYAARAVDVVSSRVVGERGGAGVDLPFPRWTSDHRAVLSELRLTPVALPTTVGLASRMLTQGETLQVRYHGLGASALTVTDDTGDDVRTLAVDGPDGTVSIRTQGLAPGGYRVRLQDDQQQTMADNEFWLRSRVASVAMRTDERRYRVGQPVTVSWDHGPANRWDWIGVYRQQAADPKRDDYLVWGYTGGHDSGVLPPSVAGSMTFSAATQRHWPLPAGRYVAYYLLTDQYRHVGSVRFAVHR